MLIDEGMDTGDILLQEELNILPTETTEELSNKLSNLGAKLLIKTLEELKSGTLFKYSQDHQKATYAPKLKKDNGLINWSQSAKKIKDLKIAAIMIHGRSMKQGFSGEIDYQQIKNLIFEGEYMPGMNMLIL